MALKTLKNMPILAILVIVGRADEPMTYLMTMMTRQSLIGLLYTVQRHIFWIQMCTTAVVGNIYSVYACYPLQICPHVRMLSIKTESSRTCGKISWSIPDLDKLGFSEKQRFCISKLENTTLHNSKIMK